MTVQPLCQRDKRWKDVKLGFSNYTIGTHGCTVTSLTMLLNYTEGKSYRPDEVNATLKTLGNYHYQNNPGGAFQNALIVWKNVQSVYPSLKFIKRAYNYSNLEVSTYVYVRKLPVMVEVNASSIGAVRHWVIFKGQGRANDPWTGTEIATTKYPLTGYSLYQRA